MLNDNMPTWYSRGKKETSRRTGNKVLSVILKSYHLWYGKSIMKKLRSLYVKKPFDTLAYVPYPPSKAKQKGGNVYGNLTRTNRVPCRHSNLCKIMSFDNICLWSGTCQQEGYRDKQQNWSEFIFHFSGKFAIQRPISNIYFAFRI